MIRIAKTLAAAAVAALALTAAATAAGPVLSAGPGCSVSCIQSAVVTTTASSASVEIKTSIPASVTTSVSKLDAKLGLAAGPKHVSVPAFLKVRTVVFPGLEPETTYRIVVSARDLSGHVQTRSGTFTTRAVKVAADLPDVGLSAGLACKADCIERGTLTSDATVPGRARLELESTVPATFQVSFAAQDVDHQLVHSTGSRKTRHTAIIDGLLTGTTYAVTVKATDANGNTRVEQGTFKTRAARAVVTFHKIHVISDSEKGIDRGEIFFDFHVADANAGWMDFRKIGSGDTVAVKNHGTSRPGLIYGLSVDGLTTLDVTVRGVECDGVVFMKNCLVESAHMWSGGYAGDTYAVTTLSVDLRKAFIPGALPGNYGTGLPAGHDAYLVWETTETSLKYRVYASLDIELS